jgi:hypothetical protein
MSNPWDQLDEPMRALLDGYGGEGVVVVRPFLVRALRGNGNAAILASELLFWSRRLGDPQGWFFQQQRRLEAQTGLGPDAQRKAVRLLVRLGVLETDRRGVPARLYYRVDLRRLAALFLQDGQGASVADYDREQDTDDGPELDRDDGPQQNVGDGQRQAAGHHPYHREINNKNKIEMKEDTPPSPPQAQSKPRRKRGRQSMPEHHLPEDFTVTAAMHAWAAEHVPHVDLDRETMKLAAWADSKGVRRRDWIATWRYWMLNAATPGPQGQGRAASPPARHTGVRRWLDQKRGQS